jgi:phage/plasmid-like protein (TIGR03299 family)
MPAGITSNDSMFSVRETPWHGLGAVLDHPPATVAEAIEASGLSWRVEREPIAVDRGDAATVDDWWEPRCEEIPGYYATVRQDTRQVLGIVGERYRIVQNDEAFQFVDQLLGSSLHFETAGSLHGGRRVWVLATLPDYVQVGGDAVRPYVLFMNSQRTVSRRQASDRGRVAADRAGREDGDGRAARGAVRCAPSGAARVSRDA